MKRKIFIIFLSLFFFNNGNAKVQNKIVVKIENQIITEYEIKNKILTSLYLSNKNVTQENIDIEKKLILEKLIQYKLIKNELSNYNIKSDDKQVNAYLNSISNNNINSLKSQFLLKNLDYDLFLDEIETQFKWRRLIYEKYAKKIIIDEKMINNEIEENIKNNTSFEEFNISEIEIFASGEKIDKKNLSTIYETINKEGFEAAAIKYSISQSSSNKGSLGWINSKSLTKKMYNQLTNIKIGEVTEPIKNQNSFIILKLVDKKKSTNQNIDKKLIRKNLIDSKKNELFNLYSRSYISKLKNSSFIQYYK